MNDYAKLLREAGLLRAASQPTDALLLLLRAARINRHGVQAHVELAELWEELGRWREAQAQWQEASRWQQLPAIRLGLARTALRLGDLGAAADALAGLRASNPREAEVHIWMARLREAEGKPDEARQLRAWIADELVVPPDFWPEFDRELRAGGQEEAAQRLYARISGDLPPSPRRHLAAIAAASEIERPQRIDDALRWEDWPATELGELICLGLPDGAAESIDELIVRYTTLIRRQAAGSGGLGWPRRTAGASLRVGIVTSRAAAANELVEALAWLGEHRPLECRVYALGELDPAPDRNGGFATAALGRIPAAQVARLIGEDDRDLLLVETDALDGKTLSVAAQRPAPRMLAWTQGNTRASARLFDGVAVPEKALQSEAADHTPPRHDLGHWIQQASEAIPQEEQRRGRAAHSSQQLLALWREGMQLHRDGALAQAEARYSQILGDQPLAARVLYMRGRLRQDAGRRRDAATDFSAALRAQPGYLDAGLALAELQLASGAGAGAVAVAQDLLAAGAEDARVQLALGRALRRRADAGAALAALQKACALAPADPQAWLQCGLAAREAGQTRLAMESMQKAAMLDTSLPEPFFNLGVLHQQLDEPEAAIRCYGQYLQLRPDSPQGYKNMGEALFAARNYSAWLGNFRRFEQRCPKAFQLAIYALEACQFAGDHARLSHYLEGLNQERFQPGNATELVDGLEELLYLLQFFDIDPELLGRYYRTYANAAAKVYGAPLPRPAQRSPGRLRLGYLCGDVKDHVMGKMVHQWLIHHDRERFEVFLYATARGQDAWAERIVAASDRFASLIDLTDAAAIARISADDLDLLVDCSTHTRGARPAILAAKPARVQVTSIASAGCLGLAAVDFKLTDRVGDLPEMQAHQVEPLLAMEGCAYPYREVSPAAMERFERSALGIREDAVLIGAFVNLLKLSRRCLQLWRDVLQRLPEALIALSPVHPEQQQAYLGIFSAAGIDPKRLVFVPQGKDESENLARYALIDLVLDPMPFGGTNGTIEALSMGVPVVTLCGRRHGERVASSILTHWGCPETIAHSGPEYLDLAFRLARERTFRDEVRARIRAGKTASVFVDVAKHVRHLEAAYLVALRSAQPEIYGAIDAPAAP